MNTESEIENLKSLADFEDFMYRNNTRGLSRKDCKTFVSLMFQKLKHFREQERVMEASLWGAAANFAKTLVGRK